MRKTVSPPILAPHLDPASVLVHNLRNDRQPQTYALRLGSKKRVENILQMLRLNPFAGVRDRNQNGIS